METVDICGLMEAAVQPNTDALRLNSEQNAGYHWPVEMLGECGLMDDGGLMNAAVQLTTIESAVITGI